MARKKVEKNIYYDDHKKLYYVYKYFGKDKDGKIVQEAVTTKTKRDARTILAKHIADISEGVATRSTKETVKDYFDWYINNIAKIKNQPTTVYIYELMLNKHIFPELGDIQLDKLTAPQIQEYITKKQTEVSANTIIKHITLLKTGLSKAVSLNKIKINPASGVTCPSKTLHEVTPYTPEQIITLLKCLDTRARWVSVLVTVAAYTGLRRGELMGLRWCDIDFDSKTLTVNQVRAMAQNQVIKGPKTDKSKRVLTLVDELIVFLKTEQDRQKENSKYWSVPYSEDGYVFVKEDGTAPSVNTISDILTCVVKANDLPHITLHGLRHTYASLIHAGGATLIEAQHALGHASPQITAGIYTHIYDQHNERAMEIAASQLSGVIDQAQRRD